MPIPRLTNEIIEAAIEGFEANKLRIDAKIAGLRAMLTGAPPSHATEPKAHKPKRKFSAEALKRMREAQQRRWAKVRGESEPPAPTTPQPAKPKRKLSKAGRANIVAALKKRWAAKKAATSNPKPAATNKAAVKKATAKSASPKASKKAVRAKKAAAKTATVPANTGSAVATQ